MRSVSLPIEFSNPENWMKAFNFLFIVNVIMLFLRRFRLMIKWNCCKIHGQICLYWTIYIIDCTTIYQMRHHCLMVKSSICWAWDYWVFLNWPSISTRYRTNCKSWNSTLVTIFAWNFWCYSIQVRESSTIWFDFFCSLCLWNKSH